ncbi:hypothetical protein PCANC_05287 [Puccinia coronata f. sp. avenae]|uniref:Uncharacterized protein n=1 Tax=Puccinia coronata f. sp. avenae TaxID=200324 RepID=A0A2N5VYV0_9BASI|nr:hypothetical protein PCANC_05287 [Puccinia coronata f. sp. avenae]
MFGPLILLLLVASVEPQTISTNMPLPPMEWIKLSTMGSTSPPALSHGCLVGPTYPDSTSSLPGFRQAFLFGGRSAAGTSSSGLYILDYSSTTPTWSQPTPTTSTLFTSSPQPRSHLLCGWDSASNFRNQLNIYGGRSEDGQPLADFWYYDPTNHFWAQPNDFKASTPNYGSVGGIDPSSLPAPPGTSNSMIYLGGANTTHSSTALTPYGISVDGQLGSNTNTVQANLSSLASGLSGNPASNNLTQGRWGASGTIMPRSKLVIFSGCNGDPANEFREQVDASCSMTNGGILSFESGFTGSQLSTRTSAPQSSWAAFNYCPAPRVGGTMVANRNGFDSSYANQVIMIGGRTDSKNWYDQGGAGLGEVAVLDITSGVWARVLPMRKDNVTFTQKEGLLALALPTPIGPASSSSSSGPTDILVYGGIDVATGQASNELWILRLHAGKLTGNGTADGVTMAYMPSCVTPTPQNKRNTTNNSGVTAESTDGAGATLEAPLGHLVFSGVALAILMVSLTILRCEEPGKLSIRSRWRTSQLWLLIGAWHALLISAGLLALAVVIALFQTRLPVPALSTLARRGLFSHSSSDGSSSSSTKLEPYHTLTRSTHARLGLAIAVFGLVGVPTLYLLSWLDQSLEDKRKKKQLSPADGGPRKLKAKEGVGLTRRTLERIVLLARHPFGRSRKQQEPQKGYAGKQHPPPPPSSHASTSMAEKKHEAIIVERRVSLPSAKRTPLLLEGLDTRSSTHTSSTPMDSHTSSEQQQQQEEEEEQQQEGSAEEPMPSPTSPRKPSPSRVKRELRAVEHPVARTPLGRFLHHLPGAFFASWDSPPTGASPRDQSLPPSTTTATSGGGFEVLNRRPPRLRTGLPQSRARGSLDIMSDAGSRRASVRLMDDEDGGYGLVGSDGEVLEAEEEEEEEEEDEEDSVYRRQTKARRKLRRLADVALHAVVLVANLFFISSCFISQRDIHWVAAIAIVLVVIAYAAILWLAWTGKPSSESTLVIFLSILKDGSKSLMANEHLAGLGQFSSFQQQQQAARQMLSQQQQPGGSAQGSAQGTGLGGRRSTVGSRLGGAGMSGYGGSQGGGFPAGYPPPPASPTPSDGPPPSSSAAALYDSHRLWALNPSEDTHDNDFFVPANSTILAEPRDSYLADREVQIVTTAPKRVLAVVNR